MSTSDTSSSLAALFAAALATGNLPRIFTIRAPVSGPVVAPRIRMSSLYAHRITPEMSAYTVLDASCLNEPTA